VESGVAIRNNDGSVVVPLDEFGIDTPLLIQNLMGQHFMQLPIWPLFCIVKKNGILTELST